MTKTNYPVSIRQIRYNRPTFIYLDLKLCILPHKCLYRSIKKIHYHKFRQIKSNDLRIHLSVSQYDINVMKSLTLNCNF